MTNGVKIRIERGTYRNIRQQEWDSILEHLPELKSNPSRRQKMPPNTTYIFSIFWHNKDS
jgi:hypothetical protein